MEDGLKLPDNYYKRLSVISCYRRNNWQGSPFWAQRDGGAYSQIWNGFPYRPLVTVSESESMRYFDLFWERKNRTVTHRSVRTSWRLR